ncbi:MAG: tetratricopeptide repeat protein [Proteobacteria bacterium]|nr:tetratricopeptide repeat protein [Pseudomonadota bacterium]
MLPSRRMITVYLALLVLTALAAASFAVWPMLRAGKGSPRAKALLGAATAIFVLAIGLGAYLVLGSPGLAVRTLQGPRSDDMGGLIAILARQVRDVPNDPKAWMLLGKGYMSLGDPGEAAAAFKRGLDVATPDEKSAFNSAYGEALVLASSGIVTSDAEDAFNAALKSDPKDVAARYYLGLAYAMRRDNPHALALWQSLLADAPANAPWRGELLDRIVALKAQSGTAPDVGAMVQSLEQRLHASPNDPEGWQRLVRSYAVLGDKPKALAAYADARKALAKNSTALATLDSEAQELKLK